MDGCQGLVLYVTMLTLLNHWEPISTAHIHIEIVFSQLSLVFFIKVKNKSYALQNTLF